ncbi:hypothetical protein AAG570_008434 [Ranatra chinensis]|uniref:Uncharacterized protein n=1 Tax=Ranatra chinensis TaxID=642074 RepID=A0ABD0YR65_9HEMI
MLYILQIILCACALVAAVESAPQFAPQFAPGAYYPGTGKFVPIVSQHFDLNPDGSYTFGYKSGDGSSRDEAGVVKNRGSANEAMSVQGQYAYSSPEGAAQVSYVADENGYQPTGSNIHPAIVQAVAEQVSNTMDLPNIPKY